MSSLTENTNNVVENTKNVVNDVKEKVMQKVSSLKSLDRVTIIWLIVLGLSLVFVGIIIWIIIKMSSPKTTGICLLKDAYKLNNTEPKLISSSLIPQELVGREYAFSFWLYLNDYNQVIGNTTTGTPYGKLIFYRVGDSGAVSSASPIVFMDPISNKLYIAIKTTDSNLNSTNYSSTTNLQDIVKNNYFESNQEYNATSTTLNYHVILKIDYIPVQRWVNIAFVVNNSLFTTFLDGEIYSVRTAADIKASKPIATDTVGNVIDFNLVPTKTSGDLSLGATSLLGNNISVNGYIGRLYYYNYAANIDDIKTAYYKGPTRSPLSIPGLSKSESGETVQYGFRSPFYKLSE